MTSAPPLQSSSNVGWPGKERSGKFVTITLVRSDDSLFFFHLAYPLFPLLCTILRPQSTTPGIACDPKGPMTDWPGPLVRPRCPVRYPADSRAWPSPLWAYNTFSHILFLSFRLASSLCSIPFHSIAPLISFASTRFYSILFDPFPCYSLRFHVSLVISASRCI